MSSERDILNCAWRRSSGFVMREIAGEVLLVPVGEQTRRLNGFVTFTETGAFLWKLLKNEKTTSELAILLAKEYEMKAEDVMPDVEDFLRKAAVQGLVESV